MSQEGKGDTSLFYTYHYICPPSLLLIHVVSFSVCVTYICIACINCLPVRPASPSVSVYFCHLAAHLCVLFQWLCVLEAVQWVTVKTSCHSSPFLVTKSKSLTTTPSLLLSLSLSSHPHVRYLSHILSVSVLFSSAVFSWLLTLVYSALFIPAATTTTLFFLWTTLPESVSISDLHTFLQGPSTSEECFPDPNVVQEYLLSVRVFS